MDKSIHCHLCEDRYQPHPTNGGNYNTDTKVPPADCLEYIRYDQNIHKEDKIAPKGRVLLESTDRWVAVLP